MPIAKGVGFYRNKDGGKTDIDVALLALVMTWLPIGMAVMAVMSTGAGAASRGLPANAIQASPLAQAVSSLAPAALPAFQAAAAAQSDAPMSTAV